MAAQHETVESLLQIGSVETATDESEMMTDSPIKFREILTGHAFVAFVEEIEEILEALPIALILAFERLSIHRRPRSQLAMASRAAWLA